MLFKSLLEQAAKKYIHTNIGNISHRFIPKTITFFNRQTLRQINNVHNYVNTPQKALALAASHIAVVSYNLYKFRNDLVEIQESNDSEQFKHVKQMIAATQFLQDTVGIPLTPPQIIQIAYDYIPQNYDAGMDPAVNNNTISVAKSYQIDH